MIDADTFLIFIIVFSSISYWIGYFVGAVIARDKQRKK